MPDPAPQPVYAFRCFLASGFAGALSVTCFALMFSLPDQWIRVAAVIGSMCTVVGIASTVVCLKLDANRRELIATRGDIADLRQMVRDAVEEHTADLSAAVAAMQASRYAIEDWIKSADAVEDDVPRQRLPTDKDNVTPMASAEIYRLGIEEGKRQARRPGVN